MLVLLLLLPLAVLGKAPVCYFGGPGAPVCYLDGIQAPMCYFKGIGSEELKEMLFFMRVSNCAYELRDGSTNDLSGEQLRFDQGMTLVSHGRATLRGDSNSVLYIGGGALHLENITLESIRVVTESCDRVEMRNVVISADQCDDLVSLRNTTYIDLSNNDFRGSACTESCLRLVGVNRFHLFANSAHGGCPKIEDGVDGHER
jgi:hypothetical protein